MKPAIARLHALLFAQQQGASIHDVMRYLDVDEPKAQQALKDLERWLTGSGLALFSHDDVYALVVDVPYSAGVVSFNPEQKQQLSQPMLEVLAVIAHKQPCTKQDIDDIRGVSSDQTLRNLVSLGLIAPTQSNNDPLKLVRYKTTKSFLLAMGIRDIKELSI